MRDALGSSMLPPYSRSSTSVGSEEEEEEEGSRLLLYFFPRFLLSGGSEQWKMWLERPPLLKYKENVFFL